MNKIDMAGPWITESEESFVLDALRNGWYGKEAYKYVELFEFEFAKYHNRNFALMTPNCTTALHLLLAALDIGIEDEVVVPDCTWIGSTACINYLGAKTVFADIDPFHWCLTPESIEKVITPKTKAIIVVDLYGNMPDWDAIKKICEENNIYLIEDAAEAVGSTYKNTKAGKFGIGSTFSFHRTKTITTGEGGMLLVDDEKLFEKCKILRDHGRKPGSYFVEKIAFKYMPFNLQAALGYAQFKRMDELVEKKRWIWRSYSERLSDVKDIFLNPEQKDVFNGAWVTALIFGDSHSIDRDKAIQELSKKDVPVRPFFYPLSSLPAYFDKEKKYHELNPVSYKISNNGINLPCALNIQEREIDIISKAIHELLEY